MSESTLVSRVVLQNYKSIDECDVRLGPLTFLVGPNGSGKSNFLDALHFVADALRESLQHAVRTRGGIAEIRRRLPATATPSGVPLLLPVEVGVEFTLPSGATGLYSIQIGSEASGAYVVDTEKCVVQDAADPSRSHAFLVTRGSVSSSTSRVTPAASEDRLYLVAASGLPEFRPVFDALSRMAFYHLDSQRIADVQQPTPGQPLASDGSNITSVVSGLCHNDPKTMERIEEYMAVLLPGFVGVSVRDLDPGQRLEFRQQIAYFADPLRLSAASMSDGTLRAFAALVALFQSGGNHTPEVRLVGIEEPEAALHPAALGVLLDALNEASMHTQVLVTSHSPELLDSDQVDPGAVLAVYASDGATQFAPLSDVGCELVRDKLTTVGDLLRTRQLESGSAVLASHSPSEEFAPYPDTPRPH